MARRTKNQTIWLVVVEAYDLIAGVDKTLRFSNVALVSAPADKPASEFFDPRIVNPCRIRRSITSPGRTFGPSEVGFGDLVLTNEDGGLDFLSDFAFDGRRITQYRGESGRGGKFSKKLIATMDQVALTRTKFTIKIKDRQTEVDLNFQENKYTGMNMLPDGLEGVSDLQGKPKPVLYGRVKNISVPIVNTSKLIYQVSDGEIESLDEVYDAGIPLSRSPALWQQETSGVATTIGQGTFGGVGVLGPLGGGRYVVVGEAGVVLTSDDGGSTWVSRVSGFGGGDDIKNVAYSESLGLFVAVGQSNTISTSPDGITWTVRTSAFSGGSEIFGIVFGNGIWVAVGSVNQVQTSSDGIAWTLQTASGPVNANLFEVVFGRNLFAFIRGGASDGFKIATSPNGATWTEREAGLADSIQLISLGFGNEQFIAAGRDFGAGTDKTIVTTSPDGITWTPQLSIATESFGLDYSEVMGRWIMAAGNIPGSENGVLSSLTGRDGSWEIHDAGFGSSRVEGVVIPVGSKQPVLTVGFDGKIASVVGADDLPYTTEAQMLLDSNIPAPGTYRHFLEGGYFRLGSPPFGQITCDATQGATLADRTAASLFTNVVTRGDLLSDDDIDQQDLIKLDSAIPDELGFWSGSSELMKSQILNLLAESVGGWWGIDALGQFRIQQLLNPDIIPIVQDFTPNDMVRGGYLQRVLTKDPGRGIPPWQFLVRYCRNFTVQTGSDLAASVTDVRRADLSVTHFEAIINNTNLQIDHLLTRQQFFTILQQHLADATAAVERFQALRGVKRDQYSFSIPYRSAVESLDLGAGVNVTHPRFMLEEGKNFIVIGFDPDPKKDIIKLNVWG